MRRAFKRQFGLDAGPCEKKACKVATTAAAEKLFKFTLEKWAAGKIEDSEIASWAWYYSGFGSACEFAFSAPQ